MTDANRQFRFCYSHRGCRQLKYICASDVLDAAMQTSLVMLAESESRVLRCRVARFNLRCFGLPICPLTVVKFLVDGTTSSIIYSTCQSLTAGLQVGCWKTTFTSCYCVLLVQFFSFGLLCIMFCFPLLVHL